MNIGCPRCKEEIKLSEDFGGGVVSCPSCTMELSVPASTVAAENKRVGFLEEAGLEKKAKNASVLSTFFFILSIIGVVVGFMEPIAFAAAGTLGTLSLFFAFESHLLFIRLDS